MFKTHGFFIHLNYNTAPSASNVAISGTFVIGQTLTGDYDYSDPEGNPESGSTFQWYRADDGSGTGAAAIGGATALTYVLQEDDLEKYIRFGVVPSDGTLFGSEAFSSWGGAVAAIPSTALLMALNISPWIAGLPFTDAGGFGAKYSDPGTIPGSGGRSATFSDTGATAVIGSLNTPFTAAYPFNDVTGFGTKHANPATLSGIELTSVDYSPAGGALLAANNATPFISGWPFTEGVGFGTKYTQPATLSPGVPRNARSVHVNKSGAAVVTASSLSPYITAWPFNAATGFGTKYTDPGTLPLLGGFGVAFARTSDAVITCGSSAPYLRGYPFNDSSGFGAAFSAPATPPAFLSLTVNYANITNNFLMVHNNAPFLLVYAFDPVAGFGAKYADPAVQPTVPNGIFDAAFTLNDSAIALGFTEAPYMNTWAFTTAIGFGAKFADPGVALAGIVRGVAFN